MNLPILLNCRQEILPCPTCFKKTGLALIADELGGLVKLVCRTCKTESEKKEGPSSAIADWNERIGYRGEDNPVSGLQRKTNI